MMMLADPAVQIAPGNRGAPAQDADVERSWPLTAVTAFFLLGGVTAAMDFGSGGLFSSAGGGTRSLHLNLAVLAFPVGIGLLRRRAAWRAVAIVKTGFGALAMLTLAFASLAGASRFSVGVAGADPWVPSEPWTGFVFLMSLGALFGWMLYILLRADTRKRFQDQGPDRPWIEWTALGALLVFAYLLF